jgi:hypothetical protein
MTTELPRTDPTNWPNTLLGLIRWAVTDFDPLEALDLLSNYCVKVLPATAGGVLLIDHSGKPQLAGASHHSAEVLELFQLESGHGPCVHCCRTGVLVTDLELSPDGPWPQLAYEARVRGFTAIYALPLISRGVVLGALNLFCKDALDPAAMEIATALADIATVMVLQADPQDEQLLLARTLRRILEARATLEQSKGVLAARYGVSPDEAFDRMRWAAERAGLTVSSLAEQILANLHRIESDPAESDPAESDRVQPDILLDQYPGSSATW